MSASALFTADHEDCDAAWARVEAVADDGDTAAAQSELARFDARMRRHLAMEEEVLFPALEEATGMRQGPTQVMRMEHEQMRGLLSQMASAAGNADLRRLVDLGDTLLVLIQQHNMKEEGILYPMADDALASEWPEIEKKLARYEK